MSKGSFLRSLLFTAGLCILTGCVTQPYRPASIDSSEQSQRQRLPLDLTQPIMAETSATFYSDINITTGEGVILSEDDEMFISHETKKTLKAGTQLLLIYFDSSPYYCTVMHQSVVGSNKIYGCFLDEDKDGTFDSVHSFAGNPRREKGSRSVYLHRIKEPIPYQQQQLTITTGPTSWQLAYMGVKGDLAQIDHIIRNGTEADASEWYRRSYFIPVSDIGKPWGGLTIPYIPFAESWLPANLTPNTTLKLTPISATASQMKLIINRPWPEAQIISMPEVQGQYRTVPFRSKLNPGG